jgi:hypothetical protein
MRSVPFMLCCSLIFTTACGASNDAEVDEAPV